MQRRDFLKTIPTAAAATALGVAGTEEKAHAAPGAGDAKSSFPNGFVWGTATAAYQVEGAVKEDGRGPSVWDTFSHTPGKTYNGDTGDVADDFYHRYLQDIALMKQLGVKAFRMSISWPRIFPQGTGQVNQKGIDFYKKLIDALLEAGITPYVTLFHWDTPQVLQDRFGGWQSREIVPAFADYAGYCAAQLSDKVKNWMTINEFRSFVDAGYGENPQHAPGIKSTRGVLAQTRHWALLAHGSAVQAVRAHAKGRVRVGLADDIAGTMPVIETPEHIRAAEKAMRKFNAAYEVPMFEGKYSSDYLQMLGADAPKFTSEEMKIIASPIDFAGINIYLSTEVMAADNADGFIAIPRSATYPKLMASWLYMVPQALYWTPKIVHNLWGVKEMYITENGCSAEDKVQADGRVWDADRIDYLRNYLTQLQRATAEGIPVKGYFLWSMLDNFEWSKGYAERFGITYVDYATQKRTPKLSFDFYKNVIARNALA